MAQQINLYNPILLSTRRYFSALAMAQSLLAIAVGIVGLCVWTVTQNDVVKKELQATRHSHVAEREQLLAAIAANPALSTDTTALEQTLKALQQAVAERQQTLDDLTQGLVAEGRSHSAMLRLVAESVPAPVWLTDVTLSTGRLEVAGMTIEPDALRPWIARLSADPLLAGQQLGRVQVEQASPATPGARPLPRGLDTWAFKLANSAPPPAASAASAASNVPNATVIADNAIAHMAASVAASTASAPTAAATASGVKP